MRGAFACSEPDCYTLVFERGEDTDSEDDNSDQGTWDEQVPTLSWCLPICVLGVFLYSLGALKAIMATVSDELW